MRRGDIVLVRAPNSPASKLRPCIVVQHSATLLDAPTKVTVCPLTSTLKGADSNRPVIVPSGLNGLRKTSEVEVDYIYTFKQDHLGARLGKATEIEMGQVDRALRRWLNL